MAWAWKSNAKRPFRRSLPSTTFALISAVGFYVASIFCSRLLTAEGREVLISSRDCSQYSTECRTDPFASTNILMPHLAQRALTYSNYARHCYKDKSPESSEDCRPFVTRRLQRTITRNASCPFEERMCKGTSTTIRLDTGYLESQANLGINTPHEDRFLYRLVQQCAPIVADGFSAVYQPPNATEGFQIMRYYYGELANKKNGSDGFSYQSHVNSTLNFAGSASTSYAVPDYSLG